MREYRVRVEDQDARAQQLLGELADRGQVQSMDHRPGPGVCLVLGGARSGKSHWAELQLADRERVEYVATSDYGQDAEWLERVRAHRERRPDNWTTIETLDLASVLSSGDEASVLVDCLSVWLSRVLDEADAWQKCERSDDSWRPEVEQRVAELLAAVATTEREVLVVSNEVGSGVVPATASGRLYRDELGRLNARVASASREVWWCVAGLAQRVG